MPAEGEKKVALLFIFLLDAGVQVGSLAAVL